jgi:DNA-binding response OmpR family regulator
VAIRSTIFYQTLYWFNRGMRELIALYYRYRKTPVKVSSSIRMSKRILIIEDDDETRELLRMALERRGYQVTVAEDGVRGYDTALFLKPDLIVTDIQMPGADGVHVVRRVRDTASIEKTPIIVTTAFGTGTATFSLQLGANAYEPKPIDSESLLSTVRRLLSDRDSQKAA